MDREVEAVASGPAGEPLYIFAYGSNLLRSRIAARCPSVALHGIGYTTYRSVLFDKRSDDGSGKANAAYTGREEDRVWGVLHTMSAPDLAKLDVHETGYAFEKIRVLRVDGTTTPAFTYVAHEACRAQGLAPYDWYLAYVVNGAREQGLPEAYIERLAAVECTVDPHPPGGLH